MKKRQSLSLALATLILSNVAMAVPSIYPTHVTKLSGLKNETNSNVLADSSDEAVFWVMPPSSGTSVVSGLHSITANVGFCRQMRDLQTYSTETIALFNKLSEYELEHRDRENDKIAELAQARSELSRYVEQNQLTELSHLDERIADLSAEIELLAEKISSCTDTCQHLLNQHKELRQEKKEEVDRRRTLARETAAALRQYERKKSAVTGIEADLKTLSEQGAKLRKDLTDANLTYMNIYGGLAQMEGARAAIIFDNKWDENVARLRQLNPGNTFSKIQTQNAVITTSIADIKTLPTNGAILNYNMGGTFSDGKLTLPSYPENSSGNVVLSLLGACPILHPEYFDIQMPSGTDQMKFGMMVSYEYPTNFVTSVVAHYNMYKMYQKIMKSGSKGGFFRSKSWNSVEEKTFFKDEFTVEWKEQDAANALTDEEKTELEKELRNQIFGRLAAIGLPTMANPGQLVAPNAPASGAVVLGNSLQNNRACASNIYCAAAAIGVQTLAAIFGRSENSASYTNIQDVDMQESWSRDKVVFKPWISSYR